ncbi:MAG: hypothetical protein RSG23_00625, partial [Gordonibacter sp.]|uniref:hypothetical protein n=1 Tax=Gordonibacter sp. TaxID=1968902 RepID=UPI002FCA335A
LRPNALRPNAPFTGDPLDHPRAAGFKAGVEKSIDAVQNFRFPAQTGLLNDLLRHPCPPKPSPRQLFFVAHLSEQVFPY